MNARRMGSPAQSGPPGFRERHTDGERGAVCASKRDRGTLSARETVAWHLPRNPDHLVSGLSVDGLGFWVWGVGCMVYGLEFRVWG